MLGDLLYRGSVKDIYLSPEAKDELIFDFSNRYSVFDWGEMPDHIENKGEALAKMGQCFFDILAKPSTWKTWQHTYKLKKAENEVLEKLKSKGLSHHALGLVDERKSAFKVKKIEVPKLDFSEGRYNYSAYQEKVVDTLVPLEVIFRFGLPQGSSLFKRVRDSEYRQVLGLYHEPKVGESFARPLIEFSTKLESTDRYITYEEAQQMAGMDDMEFSELFSTTIVLSCRLRDLFSEMGVELWDGKFEFAFNKERGFQLVDSIGPDELRLMVRGQKLSKEFLRSFYRGSPWLEDVEAAKAKAKQQGLKDWHQLVSVKPEPLNKDFIQAARSLYLTLTNRLYEVADKEAPFGDAPNMKELIEMMKKVSQ